MLTAALLFIYGGFFLFYHTSQRATLNKTFQLSLLAKVKPNFLGMFGMLFWIIAIIFLEKQMGFGAGLLTFILILMMIASAVIILAPMKLLYPKILIGSFALLFFIERYFI